MKACKWTIYLFQPSTIPQGTVNLHHCSDVIDAEGRTGQKNTLCIITADQDIYIRGDSKEIVNGSVMGSSRTIQKELVLFRNLKKMFFKWQ